VNNPTNRRIIGAAALAVIIGGVFFYWNGEAATGGVLLRSGVVLAAIWFAWPALARVDTKWILPALLALGVIATRPLLLLWLLPLLVVLGLLRRSPSSSRRRG
jgi:hypothetical protein